LGEGHSQNVVWYVVRTCCERVGLEHIAPHDLRRKCAKLCHDSGGELEQIQFLLGHASVQTTERYLGCKQNLGSPVNDRFKLRTELQPPEPNFASGAVKEATPAETASREGIQCRHGGYEDFDRLSPPPFVVENVYFRPGFPAVSSDLHSWQGCIMHVLSVATFLGRKV
jgi:integrase-like protein